MVLKGAEGVPLLSREIMTGRMVVLEEPEVVMEAQTEEQVLEMTTTTVVEAVMEPAYLLLLLKRP